MYVAFLIWRPRMGMYVFKEMMKITSVKAMRKRNLRYKTTCKAHVRIDESFFNDLPNRKRGTVVEKFYRLQRACNSIG